MLFSGTPCQTAAINRLVSVAANRWKYNLYIIDVLCHGVPSPKAWEKYLQEVCSANPASLKAVNMRDKSFGWHRFYVKLDFDDGSKHDKSFHEGIWGPSFFRNLFLRECCYDCNFKKKIRQADITLGDFWGAAREDALRKYDDDNKGTSVILINSKKGLDVIKKVQDCWIERISYECLLNGLYVLYKSSDRNYFREKAFSELDKKPYSKIVMEIMHPSLIDRVKRKIWKIRMSRVLPGKRLI